MEQGIVLESVWVAVGFVVFIALVWRKAGSAIGAMLDERSKKISSELKEASVAFTSTIELVAMSIRHCGSPFCCFSSDFAILGVSL
jgi:hypothetical protein